MSRCPKCGMNDCCGADYANQIDALTVALKEESDGCEAREETCNRLSDQLTASQARVDELKDALRQAIRQLEDDYQPTPLDGHGALIRKLQALAGTGQP